MYPWSVGMWNYLKDKIKIAQLQKKKKNNPHSPKLQTLSWTLTLLWRAYVTRNRSNLILLQMKPPCCWWSIRSTMSSEDNKGSLMYVWMFCSLIFTWLNIKKHWLVIRKLSFCHLLSSLLSLHSQTSLLIIIILASLLSSLTPSLHFLPLPLSGAGRSDRCIMLFTFLCRN